MSSSAEVEIKFRIQDRPSLQASLEQLGFSEITPRTHEMNTLFDLPGKPLRARGEVLRLRKYGEQWVLTHKAKSQQGGPHKSRIETETRVHSGEKMEAILRALQFEPTFKYEKYRAEWKREEGHVVIDETPIGDFGEIEGPPEWIDVVARQLGIRQADYITETYAGLFFAWKKQSGSGADEMTYSAIRGAGSD
jgi:adenylate cyclase, class 2